jgi:uncharacterized membrane protein
MRDVFAKLLTDFLSTIVFLVLYLSTGNVVLATSVAIAGALAQVAYSRVKGKPLGFMTYASLALVIVLGSATLLTNDPRFVLAKPSIAHFAIGAIMLKRGWMLRYMPPIAAETIPEYHHRRLCLGGADVRARPGCDRGGLDRRYQAVGVLRVGSCDRGQGRGLRGAVHRVPHPRHQPDSRDQSLTRSAMFMGLGIGCECAIPRPSLPQSKAIPVLRRKIEET